MHIVQTAVSTEHLPAGSHGASQGRGEDVSTACALTMATIAVTATVTAPANTNIE